MDANEQRALAILASALGRTMEQMGQPEPDAYVTETAAYRAVCAALAQQVPADGEWVLVPRDPTPEMIEAGIMFGNSPNKACIIYQSMLAATPQAPQPVVDAPFDPASDKPTKPGKYSEPGAEHVHKRGEAECPTCGTACRTEYVLWSSQFLGTQSRTDYIPASQPQQGAVDSVLHPVYSPENFRFSTTIGQQAVDDLRVPDAESFRLAMGELNTEQVRVAQAAFRMGALAALAANGKPNT